MVSRSRRVVRPVLTTVTLGATVALTGTRLWTAAVMHALWRDPDALRRGQAWRLLTPVLVQSDRKIFDVVSVFVVCAVVGIAGEQYLTRPAWATTYLAGALCGHAVGMAFQPHQSGTSVAFAGVLGGLGALATSGREATLRRWRFHAAGLAVLAIVDTAVRDIHGVAYLGGLAVGALLVRRGRSRPPRPETSGRRGR